MNADQHKQQPFIGFLATCYGYSDITKATPTHATLLKVSTHKHSHPFQEA